MGGTYLQRNIDSLNLDGRLFIIGLQGGATSQINLASLLARRLTVQGMHYSHHKLASINVLQKNIDNLSPHLASYNTSTIHQLATSY